MARTRRKIHSATTLRKMSNSHKGAKNGMFGRRHSEATKKKISQKLIEYWSHITID